MSNILSFVRPRFHGRHKNMLFQSAAQQGSWRAPQNSSPQAIIAEMQAIVRMAGEDGGPTIKGCVGLAARRLALSFTVTHRLWYGQRLTISAHEADALRGARGRILAERARRLQAQLDVVHARMRALGTDSDEAAA